MAGALHAVLEDWKRQDRRPVSVIYPPNRHLSAKVRAFTDFVGGLFPRPRGPARTSVTLDAGAALE